MNGCCKEVLEPSIKLGRMITLLKIVVMIHFCLIFADLFIIETGFFFLLFIQILVLLIGISSKHFAHYLLFILICFFNLFMTFQILGIWFQVGFFKNDSSTAFSFFVFIFVFEIFCIFVVFQSYKQSKQEYRQKYGFAAGENGGEEFLNGEENGNIQGLNNNQNDNRNNNNNNNDGGFVPFQGRGVAVGGN